MNPSPHSPTGRLVSVMLAVVVSFCGCTLRALAVDGEPTAETIAAPVSCCHHHACDTDEDGGGEKPDTSGCHCIHGATAVDTGHEDTLSLLAHPPVNMSVASLPTATIPDATPLMLLVSADPPPEDDAPERSPRSLRRIVVLQV